MPTERERQYYRDGYSDGYRDGRGGERFAEERGRPLPPVKDTREPYYGIGTVSFPKRKPKRKLSAWNKFVKANSKKPRFKYRDGKLNLKKMGVAFRKTPAGRKKRR